MGNNKDTNLQKGKQLIKLLTFFLCWFILIVGTNSCRHKEIKKIPCSSLLVDSIIFPFNHIDFGSVIYGKNRKDNIYFYNDGSNYRCIRYSGDGKPLDTIKYPMDTHFFTGFYPLTKDSFAVLTPTQLFLYGANSKNTLTYDHLSLKGYRFWGTHHSGYPLEISDSLAFFCKCEDTLTLNTRENWELYRESTHNETVYNLRKGQIENIQSGDYPLEIYGNSYYSLAYYRCINKEKHELIYNYPHSENIYAFNYLDKTLKKYTIKDSAFTPDDTFDFNRIGDFNYISKYLTENCRCKALEYNGFRKEYYLPILYKDAYQAPNSDEVVRYTEKPWSILVLDSNFNIKEKISFPAKKYYCGNILPLQKGFLVEYYSNIESKKNSSKYAVFEF